MAKKKKHPEHENLERWLVSYADFITLLFAFFTVMYALSQGDKEKYEKAVESIQRAFMSGGGVFALKGAPMMPFADGKGSATPGAPGEAGQYSKSAGEAQKMEDDIKGLYEKMSGVGLNSNDVKVSKTEDGYKIRLGEVVLFRAGSDKIKKDSIPFLYELGKRLSRLKSPIQIEGHTDNSASPDNRTHWQLSADRAYNVVQFLVEGAQYPPERLSLAGYGDTQPVTSNETAEGRLRNRRVEIAIYTTKEIKDLEW